MGSTTRLGACLALSVVLWACDDPKPAPHQHRTAAKDAGADKAPLQVWCPAGLLCEASKPVMGWRVPAACVVSRQGRYGADCALGDLPWDRVEAFFRSRYGAQVHMSPGTLQITAPSAPLKTPARLLAVRRDGRVSLRLFRGDKP